MKKLLFGLIAIVMFGFVGNAHNQSISKEKPKPTVITTFEPGSFSAGVFGCWGSGVCRRDIIVMSEYGFKAGTIVTNNLDGTLTIEFDSSSFSKENIEFYSNRNTFIMERDFSLNSDETKALELNNNAKILIGEYKLIKGSKYYTVQVKISK